MQVRILRNLDVKSAVRVKLSVKKCAELYRKSISFEKISLATIQDEISTYVLLKIRAIIETISLGLVFYGEKTLKNVEKNENESDLTQSYMLFGSLLQEIIPLLIPCNFILEVSSLAFERVGSQKIKFV